MDVSEKVAELKKLKKISKDQVQKAWENCEEIYKSTNKYQKFIRFKRKGGFFSKKWVFHYSDRVIEDIQEYKFLAYALEEDNFVPQLKEGKWCSLFGYDGSWKLPNWDKQYRGELNRFSPQYTQFMMEHFQTELDQILSEETLARYQFLLALFAEEVKAGRQGSSKTDVKSFLTVVKRYPSFEDFEKVSISDLADIRTFSRGFAKDLKEFVTEEWHDDAL